MPAPADCRSKDDVRAEIDRLDTALVALLGERFQYVKRMAQLKHDPGEAYDAGRINAVLSRVADKAVAAGLDPTLIEDMWRLLIEWNVAYERRTLSAAGSDGPHSPLDGG